MAFQADKYDSSLFTSGTWEEFQSGRFRIALAGNVAYRQALEDMAKKYRRQYGDELTQAQQDEITAEAMAIGMLTGWEGVTATDQDCNSVELEYSVENAKALLLEHPELVAFVMRKGGEMERFERKYADDAA
ncbi:hypothetical protein ACOJCM_14735 [Billgrantia sp. LNSP4103-1]|uniref:hypothetical protein n=1 Tax=Billgrantia sp. LNSP4103-1 TaxID=3410266 RepID=UPI00403F1D05